MLVLYHVQVSKEMGGFLRYQINISRKQSTTHCYHEIRIKELEGPRETSTQVRQQGHLQDALFPPLLAARVGWATTASTEVLPLSHCLDSTGSNSTLGLWHAAFASGTGSLSFLPPKIRPFLQDSEAFPSTPIGWSIETRLISLGAFILHIISYYSYQGTSYFSTKL